MKNKTGLRQLFNQYVIPAFTAGFVVMSPAQAQDNPVHTQTDLSEAIAALQTEFADINQNRPMIFLDIDQVDAMALGMSGGQPYIYDYADALAEYALRQSEGAINVAVYASEGVYADMAQSTNLAYFANELNGLNYNGVEEEACLIGVSPYTSQSFQLSDALQFPHNGYSDVDQYKPAPIMSGDEFARYARLTEVFHCIDSQYLPHIHDRVGVERTMIRHKTELFAEIAATLYHLSQGGRDLSEELANIRAVYSYHNGLYEAGMFTARYGMNAIARAPVYTAQMYFLHRGMDALSDWIKDYDGDLTQLQLQDIIEVAVALTEENALTYEEMDWLAEAFSEGVYSRAGFNDSQESGRQQAFLAEYHARVQAALPQVLVESLETKSDSDWVDARQSLSEINTALTNAVLELSQTGLYTVDDLATAMNQTKDMVRGRINAAGFNDVADPEFYENIAHGIPSMMQAALDVLQHPAMAQIRPSRQ